MTADPLAPIPTAELMRLAELLYRAARDCQQAAALLEERAKAARWPKPAPLPVPVVADDLVEGDFDEKPSSGDCTSSAPMG